MNYAVLVVDDDRLVNEFLVETLRRAGYDCTAAHSGEEALARLNERDFDIVVTDLKMPGMDGLALLAQVKKASPQTIVIMMTAYGTIDTAVKAIKNGAYDFLLKPVSPETVEHIIRRVAEVIALRRENELMRKDLADKFHNIVGKSKVMKEVFDLIQGIADARSTVLITGASGTGKELVARAIHYSSCRADKPFVKLNCAALPENLVESELFGYEKGAFTDAKKTTRGRFELADGGTLLLDEISEMPLNLQSKLLRVIQEREFERVGSSQTIQVDVRLVATSNRNLREYIAAGRFREDLYYRLNVIPIHLAPLEERKEDVPLLVEHFIAKYNRENSRTVKGVDAQAMRLLMHYHWPGNVRELENYIERAVVTGNKEILTEDEFPAELALGRAADSLAALRVPMKLEEGNKYLILKTLEKFNGNKTRAAEALGISARTIRNKLAEYGEEVSNS
ncbi:MAG TPA: sigma-54 dependent transcriptional regulator [candidate division Zixibacteria bacterium]|nr:sigma-54-dependent Fis family transcriptional regulator [candidate division Zixibacteria bacterium]MDD4917132.1 sigma-54 dependent transcriptional regulator [candidate division Zixibacteria bacterium]MDM7972684.1 sigma-54 dependent transcriptional regulator [candidate division Zixibacteria bacterium]HOD65400.1 sigma-54 dependent transcriptional regulator [candidate division Zixibacteria bacterium]HQL22944.1 sigma-54 dependent transcriptional regulator [candidate division Zixibacteria bacteri